MQKDKTPFNKHPGYATKPSNGEAPVLELWGMWSTSLLPLHSGQLWFKVIEPVRVQSMGQIELFNNLLYLKPSNCVQTND